MDKNVITKTITLESKGNYENETQAIDTAKKACRYYFESELETSFPSGGPFLSLNSIEWEVKEVSHILTRIEYITMLEDVRYTLIFPRQSGFLAFKIFYKGDDNKLVIMEKEGVCM